MTSAGTPVSERDPDGRLVAGSRTQFANTLAASGLTSGQGVGRG
jgi:hypothetical protein